VDKTIGNKLFYNQLLLNSSYNHSNRYFNANEPGAHNVNLLIIDIALEKKYDPDMINKYDILLCDLDAFFASVEQLDNADLRGKPVIVGGSPEGRGVVSTCSYEARKYGVRSAMPMKKAVSLCPHAIIVKGRMWRYKEMAEMVIQTLEKFTPLIEVVSIDEAYLAVPSGKGLETAQNIRQIIKKELLLPISIGVSSNKLLSKISCEMAKPDNIDTLFPEDVKQHLWPLSIRSLPGIGPVTESNLNQLGINTVGELAVFPLQTLVRVIGQHAPIIQGYANGIDNRHLEYGTEAKSISEETTFPQDIYDNDTIKAVIMELAAGVGYRLRRSNLLSRTITLKLRYSNFQTITRSKTLPDPIDSDSKIYKSASQLFSRHKGKPPWRLIGLQASTLEKGRQLSLLQPSAIEEKEIILTKTRDSLHQKYGSEVIFQASRLKKH